MNDPGTKPVWTTGLVSANAEKQRLDLAMWDGEVVQRGRGEDRSVG